MRRQQKNPLEVSPRQEDCTALSPTRTQLGFEELSGNEHD
jgi:hypothetical protein